MGREDPTAPWGVGGLSVNYGGTLALSGVDLDVLPGAVTAVIGGDGAGKTSLLRALSGVVAPSAGWVRRPPKEAVGYVAGDRGVYRDLTVDENLAFFAAAYGVEAAALEQRARALLERSGLAGTGDRLAGDLSGGMRQKLALLAALVHEPELLVLDEPTTGVDPVSRADLWRLMAGAAARGVGVVFATTYLDEAERAAFVLVLHEGRPLAAGSPDELIAAIDSPIVARASRPAPPALAWRRGREWHVCPRGPDPVDGSVVAPDLEDAVVVKALALETPQPSRVPARSPSARLPSPAPTLAHAQRVSRRFGALLAVDDVDLTIAGGEVVGLLGANGAGKTTLIRLLLGLLAATAGDALLFGHPPSRETRGLVGYVPQGLGLYDDLTVAENLAFYAGAFGAATAAEPATGLDAELAVARHTLVSDLPLGLRRRTAFAAALAHEPDLLVLDEPTSGVDPLARTRLWDTIRSTSERGAGVLVTTHHLDEAANCDRLVVMAAGRVVAAGTSAEIVGGRRAVRVRTGNWEEAFAVLDDAGVRVALEGRSLRIPGTDPAYVEDILASGGVQAELTVVPASLEEAFVALTAEGSAR